MQSLFSRVLLVFALLIGGVAQAQEPSLEEPSLEEANKVLDYAEQLYSDSLLGPSDESGEAVDFGYRWYYRYYEDADSYLGVNRDDGHLWVFGPEFGSGTDIIKVIPVHAVLAMLARPGGEPIQQEANQIFEYAEENFPELFPAPASSSGQTFEPGYRWFFRYYGITNIHLGVNLDDGYVWVMGGDFGPEPVSLMSVGEALDLIPSTPGGEGSGILNAGNDNCVAIVYPASGTLATYTMVDGVGNTRERRQVWLESSPVLLKIKSDTFIDGVLSGTSRTTTYYETHDELRYLKINEIVSQDQDDTSAGIDIQSTHRPSRLVGPSEEYCEGQQWKVASVLQTTVSSVPSMPNTAQRNQTPEHIITVAAVDEVVTVPAGTFTTVKTISEYEGGVVKIVSWVETSTGVPVMHRTYFEDDVTNNHELLEVSY